MLIYLNIFGYTLNAYTRIHEGQNLRVPKHIKPYNNSVREIFTQFIKKNKLSIKQFISKYDVFFINNDTIISILNNKLFSIKIDDELNILDTYLIYLFYKFPDHLSTYLNLCMLPIFDHETIVINNINITEQINNLENINYRNIIKSLQINNNRLKCEKKIKIVGLYILPNFKIKNTYLGQNILDHSNDNYCNTQLLTPFYKKEIYHSSKSLYLIPHNIISNDKFTFEGLFNHNVQFKYSYA